MAARCVRAAMRRIVVKQWYTHSVGHSRERFHCEFLCALKLPITSAPFMGIGNLCLNQAECVVNGPQHTTLECSIVHAKECSFRAAVNRSRVEITLKS